MNWKSKKTFKPSNPVGSYPHVPKTNISVLECMPSVHEGGIECWVIMGMSTLNWWRYLLNCRGADSDRNPKAQLVWSPSPATSPSSFPRSDSSSLRPDERIPVLRQSWYAFLNPLLRTSWFGMQFFATISLRLLRTSCESRSCLDGHAVHASLFLGTD